MLKIYNTLSKQLEEFKPIYKDYVTIYNCGPTVYDFFHIGNARNFITFDNIRKYLIYKGYKVKFIQNITDIDDKIINRANEEGVPFEEISQKYTEYFFKYQDLLGIMPADYHPRATEVIDEMIKIIKKLIQKGYAYEVDGDIYFSVEKFKDYGKLSGKKLEDLIEGARIQVNKKKRNPADFALWKSYKPGEPYWETPWGKGRPGWHLECSAMSMKFLGEQIDIHGGGIDLVFPHHENEIAQSEAYTEKEFVKYWIHNGFLEINGEKMSKSLGNFFTINEVLEKYTPQTIRFFMCLSHYRKPLDYCKENLENAKNGFNRIKECYNFLKETFKDADLSYQKVKEEIFRYNYLLKGELTDFVEKIRKYKKLFEKGMDDDFNFPKALSAIFELIKFLNTHIRETNKNKGEKSFYGYVLLNELAKVLGLEDKEQISHIKLPVEEYIELLLDVRNILRKEKNYTLADKIRNELLNKGIEIKDTPEGTIWNRK